MVDLREKKPSNFLSLGSCLTNQSNFCVTFLIINILEPWKMIYLKLSKNLIWNSGKYIGVTQPGFMSSRIKTTVLYFYSFDGYFD